jgi:ABC-type multidrug transport system permease subunit
MLYCTEHGIRRSTFGAPASTSVYYIIGWLVGWLVFVSIYFRFLCSVYLKCLSIFLFSPVIPWFSHFLLIYSLLSWYLMSHLLLLIYNREDKRSRR